MNTQSSDERRIHRRLDIHLPLEFSRMSFPRSSPTRAKTANVSTGGLYFETTADDIQLDEVLLVDLEVPADKGRFPENAKIATTAEVVRVDPVEDQENNHGVKYSYFGIAAKFQEELKLII